MLAEGSRPAPPILQEKAHPGHSLARLVHRAHLQRRHRAEAKQQRPGYVSRIKPLRIRGIAIRRHRHELWRAKLGQGEPPGLIGCVLCDWCKIKTRPPPSPPDWIRPFV